jgi:TatD DNase family protein
MKFVDTHSHMYMPQFDEDLTEALERSFQAGVDKIILPNVDAESIDANTSLARDYPENCFSLIGLHPTYVKDNFDAELKLIFSALEKKEHVGVGEIGIDLYWDKTYFEEQKEAFRQQVSYALNNDLPFVVHARDSFSEIMTELDAMNAPSYKGIFHAFGGNSEEAAQIIEKGFLLGIGGVITFKNANLSETIKQIDLKHLVLETDAPYLTPAPYRGKRNESSYIPFIAQKIAEVKNVPVEEVAAITTENAEKLFQC